ncbi:helix-turn-helix domain-containing protein [Sorangium sp. So ce341]|uniref:helix-turn-helix domain-containing protein n=1 Tax=Sorangium sp. So ce341 TaxID=3133302 RepID=UPI003F60B936
MAAKFYRFVPKAPLARCVASIWYGENAAPHALERFLPTGEVDLIVNVRDGELRRYEVTALESPRRFAGPVVSGAHCEPYVIDTAQQTSLLGVRFKVGCARELIGVPLDLLGNAHVALSDLWGAAALALQDSVMQARTPEERCARVERSLLARLSGARGPHPAVARAVSALMGAEDPSPVMAVARASGLSARRFIEVFRRDVGLAPKQFSRVMRFRRAVRLLAGAPRASLASLALEAGYCDQAHFTREFKELSGISPAAYRAASGAYDNHVPMLGVKSVQDGGGAGS